MKKKVYICAPLGGNVKENLKKAIKYTLFALRSGVAPVTPHFYALCLDDNKLQDRELGLSAGMSLLWFCDELWVFGDTVSEGMKEEIKFCENMRVKIRKIKDREIEKILEDKQNEKEIQETVNMLIANNGIS